MTNYILIGAAGFVAPRHIKAIKDTGGNLVAAYDLSDSVGVLDSYFPQAAFFTEFENLHEFVYQHKAIDYVSICSPNYLHKAHIGFALRIGANAICEKPLILNSSDIIDLKALELQTKQKVNTILQLRLHPSILSLKKEISKKNPKKKYDIDLTYLTSRGPWYHKSWKNINQKSGGIAANIGVHFFDMLQYIFGKNEVNIVHHRSEDSAAGYLEFENARVRWALSINRNHLPRDLPANQATYRSIKIDGKEIEFSNGFNDLHTLSYEEILSENGFGIDDATPSIKMVDNIQKNKIERSKGQPHPALNDIINLS